MISFTVKGKNFPSGAKYWWPEVYYYENGNLKWRNQYSAKIPINQTANFTNVPPNVGFWVGFFDASGEAIYGPYACATTDLLVLKNSGRYTLDFHSEVGVPTLEEEVPWELIVILASLLPHWPWIGPPVPSFLPPWPWYKG